VRSGDKEDNLDDPVGSELSSGRRDEKRWRCSSVVKCSPAGNGVTTEAEEPPVLIFVTRKRLVKAHRKDIECSDFSVEISNSVVITSRSEWCA
jgi:hypothetical protein